MVNNITVIMDTKVQYSSQEQQIWYRLCAQWVRWSLPVFAADNGVITKPMSREKSLSFVVCKRKQCIIMSNHLRILATLEMSGRTSCRKYGRGEKRWVVGTTGNAGRCRVDRVTVSGGFMNTCVLVSKVERGMRETWSPDCVYRFKMIYMYNVVALYTCRITLLFLLAYYRR